jgi:hypothetical protein
MASIREALHAAQTGDMTRITIREVEIPMGVRHPPPLAIGPATFGQDQG